MAAASLVASLARGAMAGSSDGQVSSLSSGEMAAVIAGSIGGAVLLVVAVAICWCWLAGRRRKARDLTYWAKGSDLEDGHMDLPDGPPLPGKRRTGRRMPKGAELQVSRSNRVDLSAEVELPGYTPPAPPGAEAGGGGGPPLAKSSMLLRWLANIEPPKDVAEQLAQGMTAEGQRISLDLRGRLSLDMHGRFGADKKNGKPRGADKRGGKDKDKGMYSDDLPLLSLAAQPGIVFAKMPPSIASSPAVSVTERSMSRHLLRGTMRRSDITQDPAQEDGDAYPPSLSRVSVGRAAAETQARQGVVFDSFGGGLPDSRRSSYAPGSATGAGGGGAAGAGVGGAAGTPLAMGRVSVGSKASASPEGMLPVSTGAAVLVTPVRNGQLYVNPLALQYQPSPPSQAHAPPQQQQREHAFPDGDAASWPAPGAHAAVLAALALTPQKALQQQQAAAGAEGGPPARAPMLHDVPPVYLATLAEDPEEGQSPRKGSGGVASAGEAPPPPSASSAAAPPWHAQAQVSRQLQLGVAVAEGAASDGGAAPEHEQLGSPSLPVPVSWAPPPPMPAAAGAAAIAALGGAVGPGTPPRAL